MRKITLFTLLTLLCIWQSNGQFTQNFDAGTTIPAGWSVINGGGANAWTVGSGTEVVGGAHSGTNAARIVYNDTAHDDYLITPAITVMAGVNTRISFWVKSRSATFLEPYEVRVSTTNNTAAASFSVILQASQNAPAAWTKKELNLEAYVGQTIFVAIRATGTNKWELYADDFINDSLPTCIQPTALTASAITTTSANVSWTAPAVAPAFGYDYYRTTTNTAPTATTTPTGNVTGTSVSFTDLTANTPYYVWVRSKCSETDLSDWSQLVNFTTPCDSVGNFTEGFETTVASTVMPSCWSRNIVSSSTNSYIYVSTSDFNTGTKALRMGNSDAATATLYAITPALSALPAGTHRLRFYVKGDPSITLQVGTMTNPADANTFTLKQAIPLTTAHQQHTVNFNTTTSDSFIAFKATYATAYYFVSIDDVVWELTPSCLEPSNVVVSNIATNSATLSWTGVSNATLGYDYYVSTTNTAPTVSTVPTGSVDTGVTTTSLSVNPSSTYYVWVRSKCSSTDTSVWTATPVSFTTLCAPTIVPSAVEGFEVTTTLPNCWSNELITGTTNWTVFTPNGAGDIPAAKSGTRIISKSYTSSDALLFSTPFDYSSVTNGTRVNVWLYRHTSAANNDRYRFFVNTSKSLTGATQIFELFLKATIAPTVTANGWYNYTFDIPTAMNGNAAVYVIVQGTTANGFSSYTLGMDDFVIESTLSTSSFDTANFKAYPNPVKDFLNLSYTQEMTHVTIFNLLGQQVFSKKVNATEGQIDMSGLPRGNYMVKVMVNNQVKTIKVVKQ